MKPMTHPELLLPGAPGRRASNRTDRTAGVLQDVGGSGPGTTISGGGRLTLSGRCTIFGALPANGPQRTPTDPEVRLTRLRLNGFKSFVDPTDLVIHDGLTGVVGPNGCGKSNLLEALRWVMGENRPTAMRGGGMEDVIFNGAASRGARAFAEVALVIDNADRLAPAGFNEADQIEVVRRITRDAGSAYRVNSREARARDVQMLFADASTGSHSPALVRQGQIAELISAKPKARRRVLEEAAGISGLYQRRHEAELRLTAAEANLLRVDDVLDALAQQLSVLARQAKQAMRYREIGEALRRAEGTLRYLRWREADAARLDAETALRLHLAGAAQAEAAARRAGGARDAAEAGLPALRDAAAIAGVVVQRLAVQCEALGAQEVSARAAIAGLRGQIAQLGLDVEREAGLNRDASEVIDRLVWEVTQLDRAHAGHDAALSEAVAVARAAAAALAAEEAALAGATEEAARLAARHQSVQRLLAEGRAGLERASADALRARSAVGGAEAEVVAAEANLGAALAAQTAVAVQIAAAEDALTATEAARGMAQADEGAARAARSTADGEVLAMRAEVAALARMLVQAATGAAPVLDRVQVMSGYEAALGAALTDDLRAAEVVTGAGWVLLPDYTAAADWPAGVTPLASAVQAPPVLARRLAMIGLVDAARGAALQADLSPGQRLVSMAGDVWRWDGLRSGTEAGPSASALRLQQINRLAALRRDFAGVEAQAEAAAAAHGAVQARLEALLRADGLARDARRSAEMHGAEAARVAARAGADCVLATGRLEESRLAVLRADDAAADAGARMEEALAAAEGLGDPVEARSGLDAVRLAVEAARVTMLTRRSAQDDRRRDGEARMRRRQEALSELSGWQARAATAAQRSADLASRQAVAEADLARAMLAPAEVARLRDDLDQAIVVAEERRSLTSGALATGETALRAAAAAERDAERAAGEAREARARAEARTEAASDAVAQAVARIAEETGGSPEHLLHSLKVDVARMPGVEDLETDVARLRRQREALGAVNLRAEDDARTVEAEYDGLAAEKGDLEAAIKTLRSGIASLNREGRERLLTAFEQVNTNFAALFAHLFGGGEARLVLVESADPLDAGLEIMCQPPGKKLAVLSLLSGGEQTLTALALIFGVFLANPAPICVLDEVDAPLDDANVTRFCDLLDEMARRTDTRFLIITHHAVTMARMDRLFGVTMAEQGVSQLVSVDLKRAAALVA